MDRVSSAVVTMTADVDDIVSVKIGKHDAGRGRVVPS